MYSYQQTEKKHGVGGSGDIRLKAALIFCLSVLLLLVIRLFIVMILEHGLYAALAAGSQEMYSKLVPKRGDIFIQDSRSGEEYPIAMNRAVFTVYVDTRAMKKKEDVTHVLDSLGEVFHYDDARKEIVRNSLQKSNDPYEPIEKSVDETVVNTLRAMDLPGIGFARQEERYYPEGTLAAHVVGFVGKSAAGGVLGQYGIEGYWQTELAGTSGFLEAAKSVHGTWIPLAGRSFDPAEDGADILLTIDRTLQFHACERLREATKMYEATSGALIIMDPKTGAIRAMCSMPDFDPNTYNQVEDVTTYNNTAIFTAYEPGSIFKPVTMLIGLDEGVVSPQTVFHDSGSTDAGCTKPIKNAEEHIYGDTTMTGVLEHSINTGIVYVVQKIGKEKFIKALEAFGFGLKQGIDMDTEVGGTIDTLYERKGNAVDCYTATAAFGQGIAVTPLQMTTAFSAIANGGSLMKPYIVEEVRHSNGRTEQFQPREVRRIAAESSASMLAAMLVRVVDTGQSKNAAVPGYYVAGKTGTAQIAGPGGYGQETNHSFIGFAPIDDPKFVMFIKLEKPNRAYADSTTAPLFGELARFILDYYHIPPSR